MNNKFLFIAAIMFFINGLHSMEPIDLEIWRPLTKTEELIRSPDESSYFSQLEPALRKEFIRRNRFLEDEYNKLMNQLAVNEYEKIYIPSREVLRLLIERKGLNLFSKLTFNLKFTFQPGNIGSLYDIFVKLKRYDLIKFFIINDGVKTQEDWYHLAAALWGVFLDEPESRAQIRAIYLAIMEYAPLKTFEKAFRKGIKRYDEYVRDYPT